MVAVRVSVGKGVIRAPAGNNGVIISRGVDVSDRVGLAVRVAFRSGVRVAAGTIVGVAAVLQALNKAAARTTVISKQQQKLFGAAVWGVWAFTTKYIERSSRIGFVP